MFRLFFANIFMCFCSLTAHASLFNPREIAVSERAELPVWNQLISVEHGVRHELNIVLYKTSSGLFAGRFIKRSFEIAVPLHLKSYKFVAFDLFEEAQFASENLRFRAYVVNNEPSAKQERWSFTLELDAPRHPPLKVQTATLLHERQTKNWNVYRKVTWDFGRFKHIIATPPDLFVSRGMSHISPIELLRMKQRLRQQRAPDTHPVFRARFKRTYQTDWYLPPPRRAR